MFLNCFLIEDICLINSKQPEKTIKVLQGKKMTKGQDAQYTLPQGKCNSQNIWNQAQTHSELVQLPPQGSSVILSYGSAFQIRAYVHS